MFEEYYSPEQLQYLKERAEQVGQERIAQVQQEWHDLIAAVQHEQRMGTDPSTARMQELATKWRSLIDEFTGGDRDIEKSLRRMYQDNAVKDFRTVE